jgi:hypothetical protein
MEAFIIRGFVVLFVLVLCVGSVGQAQDFVPVPGDPNALVIDSQGRFAYITNGGALLVLDLTTQQLIKNFPVTFGEVSDAHVADIDQGDSLLALHDFSNAAIADATTGVQEVLIQSSAITGATFANGFLYASSFNDRASLPPHLMGRSRSSSRRFLMGGRSRVLVALRVLPTKARCSLATSSVQPSM